MFGNLTGMLTIIFFNPNFHLTPPPTISILVYYYNTATKALEYAKLVEDTLVQGFGSKALPKSKCGKDREFSLAPKTSL